MLTRVAAHLGARPADAAAQAPSTVATPPTPGGGGLTAEHEATFKELGFVVCRNMLSPSEARRLAEPIHDGFKNHLYEGKSNRYPDPSNRYSLGSRVLLESPDVASVSCDHPKIIGAVEQLLGGGAVLSQYQSYLSPPGYNNGGASGYTPGPSHRSCTARESCPAPCTESNQRSVPAGHGCHYDYKPYRPVGSFLSFIFAVVPLSNYTPEAGPLLLSPRSHLRSRMLPSDGRVHGVEVACVPPLEDIELVDPNIGLGDVVFMHCYCWHAYCPNTSDGDRFGLYMKFHPKSSPPSNGPLLHPQVLSELLSPEHRHLVPYTCPDTRYYSDGAINEGMQTIDRAALLLEDDRTGRVLLQRQATENGAECWGLPSCEIRETKGWHMDNSNVIGQLGNFASSTFGLELRWMSWIADCKIQQAGVQEQYQVERVYAHRLGQPGTVQPPRASSVLLDSSGRAPKGQQSADLRWFTLEELSSLNAEDLVHGLETTWVRMWQREEDEDEQPVQRGYGFPLNTGGKFGCTSLLHRNSFLGVFILQILLLFVVCTN